MVEEPVPGVVTITEFKVPGRKGNAASTAIHKTAAGPARSGPDRTAWKAVASLRYEKFFYFYMGGTLVLGLYLAIAGFSA